MLRRYLNSVKSEEAAYSLRKIIHRRKEFLYQSVVDYVRYMISIIKRIVRKRLRYLSNLPAGKIKDVSKYRNSIVVCNRQLHFLEDLHQTVMFLIYDNDQFIKYMNSEFFTSRDIMVQFFKDAATLYKSRLKWIEDFGTDDETEEETLRYTNELRSKIKICKQLSRVCVKIGASYFSPDYIYEPMMFDRHLNY